MSDIPFFNPATGEIDLRPEAFKFKLKNPQVKQFLGAGVEAVPAETRAKYPGMDEYRAFLRWKPVSYTLRPDRDGNTRTEEKEFLPISDAQDGKMQRTIKSCSEALKVTVQSLSHLNNFAGAYFEVQEVPLRGQRYEYEVRDAQGNPTGETRRAVTYTKFLRVVPTAEAEAIVPADRGSTPTPVIVTDDVDAAAVITGLVGTGGTQGEIMDRFFDSPYVNNIAVSSAVMTGQGLEQLVEEGLLIKEGDRYQPADAKAAKKAA